jgi:flagellar M-ring protein FliF
MVRMVSGRQLSDSQVTAIANLVAGSVPGLSPDAVRIVDQHGRLLSQTRGADSDRLELQSRMEAKLQAQIEQLLVPMVGADNFTAEIQVDLDMNEVTSARESYDKDGAVRRETTETSQNTTAPAVGVPGVLSNTPPPAGQARPGAPTGGPAQAAPQGSGESSSSRTYELGREVSVSNATPGDVKRISVAVALNQSALKGAKAADVKKFEQLVAAAVGANPTRGDVVTVVERPFEAAQIDAPGFWETGWFAMILRNAVALIAVVLVLLFAVRPVVKAVTGRKGQQDESEEPIPFIRQSRAAAGNIVAEGPTRESLSAQIELAQRIVREQPDDALQALRRMLSQTPEAEGTGR